MLSIMKSDLEGSPWPYDARVRTVRHLVRYSNAPAVSRTVAMNVSSAAQLTSGPLLESLRPSGRRDQMERVVKLTVRRSGQRFSRAGAV